MDPKTRILILHATAGHGHQKAAEAVAEAIAAMDPAAHVRVEDALSFTPKFFGSPYKGSYLYFIQKMSWGWGFLYHVSDHPAVYWFLRPIRRIVNGIFAGALERLILKEKPTTIVSTHFLSTEVAAQMKHTGRTRAKVITVVTDFMPHTFWVHRGVDLYAAALPETRAELERRGVPADKIVVTGIPISEKFSERASKAELRKTFGLDPQAFTVLLTSGGAGVGPAGAIARRLVGLPQKIQALVVCGTNAALYGELSEMSKSLAHLKVYGFVNNMNELMSASDVVVGKGGGLTISESLALGVPMIVFEPVPGQETRNAVILEKRGAGILAHDLEDVIRSVSSFASSPKEAVQLAANAAETGRPDAAAKVAELALHG